MWGVVAACRTGASRSRPRTSARLERLAGLVGTAVGVAQARDLLVHQATTDGLTGLFNHRAFHDLLRGETVRAQRYDARAVDRAASTSTTSRRSTTATATRPATRCCARSRRALQGVVRASETVARLGGDEFALLLPETDLLGAHATAERVRDAIGALPAARGHGVTASAGVADLAQADVGRRPDPPGRRRAVLVQGPRPQPGLGLRPRARRRAVGAASAPSGWRARTRSARCACWRGSIDLKDPATHHHSERVADAARSCWPRELGWAEARRALLHDAALVHDVGKVVLARRCARQAGALTAEEGDRSRRTR